MAKASLEVRKPAPPPAGFHATDVWHAMRNEMDRLFDRFSSSFEMPALGSLSGVEHFWPRPNGSFGALPVDVTEDDKAYTLTAELPGLDEEDFDVSVTGDVLTLKGEKRAEGEEKEKSHYLCERSYGTFQRSFELPPDVDADKIDAKFSKGLLTVMIPKNPKAQASSKKIQVKAA